jgi:hypothetical protein
MFESYVRFAIASLCVRLANDRMITDDEPQSPARLRIEQSLFETAKQTPSFRCSMDPSDHVDFLANTLDA